MKYTIKLAVKWGTSRGRFSRKDGVMAVSYPKVVGHGRRLKFGERVRVTYLRGVKFFNRSGSRMPICLPWWFFFPGFSFLFLLSDRLVFLAVWDKGRREKSAAVNSFLFAFSLCWVPCLCELGANRESWPNRKGDYVRLGWNWVFRLC